MEALGTHDARATRALRLTILTAGRATEVEFDRGEIARTAPMVGRTAVPARPLRAPSAEPMIAGAVCSRTLGCCWRRGARRETPGVRGPGLAGQCSWNGVPTSTPCLVLRTVPAAPLYVTAAGGPCAPLPSAPPEELCRRHRQRRVRLLGTASRHAAPVVSTPPSGAYKSAGLGGPGSTRQDPRGSGWKSPKCSA